MKNSELYLHLMSSRKNLAEDIRRVINECPEELIWHPLGFMALKLAEDGANKARMHIWPKELRREQKPAWLIHNHTFNLKSSVVHGCITDLQYELGSQKNQFTLYEVDYFGSDSIINKSENNVSLTVKQTRSYSAGEHYYAAAGDFHSSQVDLNGTTITLCETSVVSDEAPLVVGEVDGLPSYTYNRKAVDQAEIQKMVISLENEINTSI